MFLKQIYDPNLAQYAYLIGCQKSGEALIIDAERDIDRYLTIAKENDLTITAAAETHIHADFLSGTRQLVEGSGGVQAFLSREGGEDWQYEWAQDHEKVTLIGDGDSFSIGKVQITALHLPGHTPEHLCFLVEDLGGGADQPMALVSGDFMFVGDVGRPDLLETAAGHVGSQEPGARQLFQSIQKFAKLPEFIQVLPGHGAGSACGKSLGSIPFSTTGYELRFNSAVKTALDDGEDAFVAHILEGQPEPPMYFARMKKMNREGAPVLEGLPQVSHLTPEQVADLHAERSAKRFFVDTRGDRLAFMKHHLAGSIYAPFGAKFSESVGSYVEDDAEVVLLVENEEQLDSCLRQLIRIGLDHISGYALAEEVISSERCQSCLKSTKTIGTTDIDSDDLVLDVRSAREHAEASVPGAVNVAHTRVVADSHRLPELGEVTVHCGSGMRAALATGALERLGFDVTYADGMFSDWKEQAKEVATSQ
jgi:hydroxyacylglutathione hydrolase